MGHRAAVYSVCVHPVRKTKDLRRLGNFDDHGHYLGTVFERYLKGLAAVNDDGSKVAHCIDATLDDNMLDLVVSHGVTGFAADIFDSDGDTALFHQEPDHTHTVRCGGLLYLPKMETRGWWVVHINNGRSVKSLVQRKLIEQFREEFEGLMLKITPSVDASALDAAIDSNRIDKVKLVKLARPSDIAEAVVGEWVESTEKARIELDISTYGRDKRVQARLLRLFRTPEQRGAAFRQIVEFGNLTFDEAKVEVILPNGDRRTFNIQEPEGGHAVTRDLTDLDIVDGEPTEDSLKAELRRSLDLMMPPAPTP
jgi:hypothetical protein